MSFGPSMSARYNDTPRFDLLGDAVDAAETATSRAEMLAAAREDAAQSFANARIDAAKRGLANAQSQASGIRSQGFLNAGMSVLSGGLQGGFKPGGLFNRTPQPSLDTPFNADTGMKFADQSYSSKYDFSNLFG